MKKWLVKNRKTIFYWAIILCIAPVFIEVIFLADLMGAEVTVGFLALLYKEYKAIFLFKLGRFREEVSLIIKLFLKHPAFEPRIYFFHSVMSVFALVVFGSVTYSILIWYPVILGGKGIDFV